jgi:hypothetical protein
MLQCLVALLVSVMLPLVPLGLHALHVPLFGLKHAMRFVKRG